jgi:serine/threonine-protein kinase
VTNPFSQLAAALADHYRLERELGQGGMATVYLAEDVRHHRRVAIKVLRPELAAVIGAERFVREIETIAALQHPHILGLIDSGEVSGTAYYVMPFVEGESLRDRLTREKQLSIPEAVRIATEVASALDYAHRRGIIHRDIKPENILLHDGSALVADFGIALAVSQAGGARMTETGMSLGTPQYMSPEQAMGEREITARSDLYALGAVTYEMLVGEPPFAGPTAQSIVAKILTEDPRPLIPKRHTIPPNVETAVLTALEKLPADRFATAAAFAEALAHPITTSTPVARVAQRESPEADARRWRWIAAGSSMLALVLGAAAAWTWAATREPPPVSRFAIELEGSDPTSYSTSAVISPDGKHIAYADASSRLVLRDLDRSEATPVPDGETGQTPFFSPDGQKLAFTTALPGSLRVVGITGGTATTLVRDSAYGAGGAWSDDGWIYFVGGTAQALLRVRADGGAPELMARPDSTKDELFFNWPQALPGGHAIVFTIVRRKGESDIAAMDIRSRTTVVLTRGLRALFAPTGHLVLVQNDGSVEATRFDARHLRLIGRPVTVAQAAAVGGSTGANPSFTLSRTGTFIYDLAPPDQQVVRVNRDGAVQAIAQDWSGQFAQMSLSPDGSRLAITVLREGRLELWVRALTAGSLTRIAYEGTYDYRPSWTQDGRSILFVSDRSGQSELYQAPADGSGSATLVRRDPRAIDEGEFSRDARWLIYRTGSGGGRDIYGVRLNGDSTPVPLVTSSFEDYSPALSPDGRWLAYGSDESGSQEVYVRPFPDAGTARWQVSHAGGNEPVWSHSGHELFFRSAAGDLVAAELAPGAGFRIASERALFRVVDYFADGLHASYSVSPDDRFFLFVRRSPGAKYQVTMVLNWFEELKAKVGE